MKEIPINPIDRGFAALVDDEDYEFLSGHRWSISHSNRTAYANTSIQTSAGYKCVSMHRMVIGDAPENWMLPADLLPLEHTLENGNTVYIVPDRYRRFRTMTVDHIDGNGLNNPRQNLRHLSCADQAKNRRFF